MSKSFKVLREHMPAASRERAAAKTWELLRAMPLYELRQARSLTQQERIRR